MAEVKSNDAVKEPGLLVPSLGRMNAPLVLAVAGLSTHAPPVTWAEVSRLQPSGSVAKSLEKKVFCPTEYVGEPLAAGENVPATVRVKPAVALLVKTGAASPVPIKTAPQTPWSKTTRRKLRNEKKIAIITNRKVKDVLPTATRHHQQDITG